jgi:serine/threonine-protein kinase RsbT
VTERAAADETVRSADADGIADLIPMIRRIVASRVGQHPSADDLVQETLVRMLAAHDRIEPGMVEPSAPTGPRWSSSTSPVRPMWTRRSRTTSSRPSTPPG